MKKMLQLFLFIMFLTNFIHAGDFQSSNSIVVVRFGDGGSAIGSTGTAVFLDEYTTAGVFVQTLPLPTTTVGSNRRLVCSGSATSEGLMTLSQSGSYLVLAGYDAAVGTASITSSTSALVSRVIAVVDVHGTINTTTELTDAISGGNPRGVAAIEDFGLQFWLTGTSTGGGIRYATISATTSTSIVSTPTNIRAINIFNHQLYVTSSTGTFQGVSAIGTGIPSTSGQTMTLLSGFPVTAGVESAYAFAMSPDGNTIYVADDAAGIQKWTLSSGTWTKQYTLNPSPVVTGFRGITVCWACGNPIIYATGGGTSNNSIYTVTDDGSGTSVLTILASAGTNKVFRGIAFAPLSVCPVELSSFTSNVIGRNVSLNWETKTEKNSDKFDIEKQKIGASWESIGSVKAAVLSNSTKQYSFSDNNLNTGVYQYRLKMIDNDGSFKYSSVTEAAVSLPKNFELLQNYPNPFNPSTKINYNLPSDAKVTLDIYNVLGVRVGQLVNQDQSAGYYSVDFNASSLNKSIPSGVYLYKITTVDKVMGNSFSAIKKMMMLK